MKKKTPYQQPQMLIVQISCLHMLSQSRLDVRKSDEDEDNWADPSNAD